MVKTKIGYTTTDTIINAHLCQMDSSGNLLTRKQKSCLPRHAVGLIAPARKMWELVLLDNSRDTLP